MNALVAWSQSLNERERRLVLGAGLLAILVLLYALVSLDRGVAHAQARLVQKQQELAWMRSVEPQLAAAGPATAAPTSQRSLIVIVDQSAREVGLGTALASSEPSPQGGLSVKLDKAPFDTLVGWLARLAQQNRVRVESATIDGAGAAGLVNATIVLRSSP
ncbi:MAG TPA: type II secretion system protein M [Steroidobacteraceae bacterium]|nr:type II secretion system protein M [Steroidobacteraceae bacterium]